MASRSMQQTARRLALAKPSSIATGRALLPASAFIQTRPASISAQPAQQVARDESMGILVKQRLQRPVAPHLTIYKPQITWILSSLNRITGSLLSGGLYVFGALYAVAPVLGLSITSAGMAAAFAKWPVVLQVLAKAGVAAPFWFHNFNGLRHLVWDMGRQLTNVQVIRTGWAVVGLTAVSTLATVFLL